VLCIIIIAVKFDKLKASNFSTCPTEEYPRHCCLGRCRTDAWLWSSRIDYHIEEAFSRASRKAIENVLWLLNKTPHKIYGCLLTFLGDSVTSDSRIALLCQLYQMGYRNTSCLPSSGGDLYGQGENYQPCEHEGDSWYSMTLAQTTTLMCPTLTLAFRSMDSSTVSSLEYAENYRTRFVESDPIAVHYSLINWGIHCNDPACMDEILDKFAGFVNHIRRNSNNNVKFIWRETTAQHFIPENSRQDANTGPYVRNRRQKCGWRPNIESFATNYRNILVENHMKNGTFPRLPIIQFWEWSNERWMLHRGVSVDCTHFCYVPSMYYPIWHQLGCIIEFYDRNSTLYTACTHRHNQGVLV